MNNTLLLTGTEQKMFAALPSGLREGWDAHDESLAAFETDEQLRIRANMAEFDQWPSMKPLLASIAKGKDISADQAKDIPEEALPELLFTIGARGISMLMAALFASAKTDEDVKAIAGFSHLRHDILETNSSISYT